MAIDTAGFSGVKTAAGGVRNSRSFWRAWSNTYGHTLSEANQAAIGEGLAPTVDETWLQTFPEQEDYLGQTLVHHHLDRGPLAIPLPAQVHGWSPGFGYWHDF
jgi:hypothetical protein